MLGGLRDILAGLLNCLCLGGALRGILVGSILERFGAETQRGELLVERGDSCVEALDPGSGLDARSASSQRTASQASVAWQAGSADRTSRMCFVESEGLPAMGR